ncbi:hypothetical protein AMTR_s00001p00210760 [Amborella trichopoda]|uniref:Uncharacterized protein n=1 Tax=Amborella trichopoda TaxID=13333 RepID=W1NM51_AMBTC|nr:hypothetical protein AMTR_s00001p00210760 [Amborella trichopoda]
MLLAHAIPMSSWTLILSDNEVGEVAPALVHSIAKRNKYFGNVIVAAPKSSTVSFFNQSFGKLLALPKPPCPRAILDAFLKSRIRKRHVSIGLTLPSLENDLEPAQTAEIQNPFSPPSGPFQN